MIFCYANDPSIVYQIESEFDKRITNSFNEYVQEIISEINENNIIYDHQRTHKAIYLTNHSGYIIYYVNHQIFFDIQHIFIMLGLFTYQTNKLSDYAEYIQGIVYDKKFDGSYTIRELIDFYGICKIIQLENINFSNLFILDFLMMIFFHWFINCNSLFSSINNC